MRPLPPSQRQVYFSAALTAAAVAVVSPSIHLPSPPHSAVTAELAVLKPTRTSEQPAIDEPRGFAARPPVPVPSPSPSPSKLVISDDLESAEVIPSPSATAYARKAVQAPAPAPQTSKASYPSYTPVPSQSGAYGPVKTSSASSGSTSSFQACVIARESGGNPQVMNASGHYGLYQFSASTWAEYGGSPADFGHASVAEQNQVFANAMAAGGEFNWAPYDGC